MSSQSNKAIVIINKELTLPQPTHKTYFHPNTLIHNRQNEQIPLEFLC